ncbi:hypothetical protein CON21_26300 [Bacillus thuringiensis]|nr:hypothetical protein CON21_26300 [Bacillus thuringiensis]
MKFRKYEVIKQVAHSKKVLSMGEEYGWLPGARYTNLRDIKSFDKIGFIDIDWKNYDFKKHLEAVKAVNPIFTIARDIEDLNELDEILSEAAELSLYADNVLIVPKDTKMTGRFEELIPKEFLLGYSVPSKYGGTEIPPYSFDRPVHLLGGRPDVQRKLAELMPVVSFDCNRFTLDARFGDYFDGNRFIKHPIGGYETCLRESFQNINLLWEDYTVKESETIVRRREAQERILVKNV